MPAPAPSHPPPPAAPPAAWRVMEPLVKDQEDGPPAPCPTVIASNPSFICVTVKSPQTSTRFLLPEVSTIQQFKEDIAKRFGCEASQLVLVFFGRILRDQDTLRKCGVSDGMTVHLVIRKRDPEDTAREHSYELRAPECTPEPPSPSFSPSSQEAWCQTEEKAPSEWPLVPTSEMIVQKVRQVILANPEVQRLAQQVPAIRHILNNMGIMRVILNKMREIVDMAKGHEVTPPPPDPKGPDQALVSLPRNIPGGDNPLRRLNSEIQEPVPNAASDPFAVSSCYSTMVRDTRPEPLGLRGQRAPMEEPHRPLGFSQSATSVCTNVSDDGASLFNTFSSPIGHSLPTPSPVGPPPGFGPFNPEGLHPPDPAEIPLMIVHLCNAYTKRMMFSLMQDALLASEGARGADPERVRQQELHFSQQMQSPEMVAAMSNPKAIQAWVQMEQGLQALLAEAPVLIPWFLLRLKGLGYSTGREPWANDPRGQAAATME
nr:ubiquilin-1-like [Anolis sagrei ordinatus]